MPKDDILKVDDTNQRVSVKNNRYYMLDFWRGAACLMVVLFHSSIYVHKDPAFQFPGHFSQAVFYLLGLMWIGVPFFFVISGYCITAACASMRGKPRAVSQFFLRRFRRIFPPYWAMVLIALCLVTAASLMGYGNLFHNGVLPIPEPESLSLWQWSGNIGLVETWRPHVSPDAPRLFMGHAWSLCYEEQFYAVCGILLFTARRWFFRALAAVTVLVAVLTAIRLAGLKMPVNGFFFDGRWLLFATGVLVYWRLHHARRKWVIAMSDVALLAGAICCGVAHWVKPHPLAQELAFGTLFAFMIAVLYRWDVPMARNRWTWAISFCGVMCYSLYLMHWPIVKAVSHLFYMGGVRGAWPTLLVTIPVCVVASVAVSWGFHCWVERRFLNTPAMMPHLLMEKDKAKTG